MLIIYSLKLGFKKLPAPKTRRFQWGYRCAEQKLVTSFCPCNKIHAASLMSPTHCSSLCSLSVEGLRSRFARFARCASVRSALRNLRKLLTLDRPSPATRTRCTRTSPGAGTSCVGSARRRLGCVVEARVQVLDDAHDVDVVA